MATGPPATLVGAFVPEALAGELVLGVLGLLVAVPFGFSTAAELGAGAVLAGDPVGAAVKRLAKEFVVAEGSAVLGAAAELGAVELGTVELGAVELGAVALGAAAELVAVELGAVELGAVELGAAAELGAN